MGAVPKAKAGVGSAINDATRILGATLGVAVIGSIYASLYGSRLDDALSVRVPESVAQQAHSSVGAALGIAGQLQASGQATLAHALSDAASTGFFRGFNVACLVAAGISAAGACFASWLLPARPPEQIGQARPATSEGVGASRAASGNPDLAERSECALALDPGPPWSGSS